MYMCECTSGLLKSVIFVIIKYYLHVCVHSSTRDTLSNTFGRFLFRQGVYETGNNCSVPGGFWTIDVEIDNERYRRYTHGLLFTKFEVPTGASYACGNNYHNMFVPGNNDTANMHPVYKFSSMQVCITLSMCALQKLLIYVQHVCSMYINFIEVRVLYYTL